MVRAIIVKSLLILLLLLNSCLGSNKNYRYQDINDKSTEVDSLVNIDLEIKLNDEKLESGEDILLELNFVNNSNKIQKILIDKPGAKFGPWGSSTEIVDLNTNESVIKVKSLNILNQNLYSKEELEPYYYYIEPDDSYNLNYKLTNMVGLIYDDNILKTGTYEIQMFYYSITSNKVYLEIE